ncbi:MAG: hypothetical protein ACE5GE_10490 [Phycisphaerae bacterium]
MAASILLVWASIGWAQTPETDRLWTVREGTTTLSFDLEAMEKLGLRMVETDETASAAIVPGLSLGFSVDTGSTLVVAVDPERRVRFVAGEVRHLGGLSFGGSILSSRLFDFGLTVSATPEGERLMLTDARSGTPVFSLSKGQVGWNPVTRRLRIARAVVSISNSWAQSLGRPELAGNFVGTLDSELTAEPVDQTLPLAPGAVDTSAESQRGVIGPDVTQCRQAFLTQFGREGSIIGCALTTTSLNVGDAPMDWFENPSENHPFIATNLFRLKDDRFEQIGQSWLKHGFFSTNQENCGPTNCVFPGSGSLLGVGCTDTYGAQLNALQSVLGPRSEVNPWTGAYTYIGSHLDIGAGGHNGIDHRLQVHDDDLDTTLNAGATYYSESYYVAWDDVEHTNNLVWKEVTPSGAPLGTWTFAMSGLATPPAVGPALDAWGGARTVIGGTVEPNNPNADSDGRCYVDYKATDLGGGQFRYEYALYNLDMDRAIQSFSVPIPLGVTVSNQGTHHVASHGEGYSNVPWAIAVNAGSITFSCDTFAVDPNANALRWGTLYNFRFDADAFPGQTTATFGLFKPGGAGDPAALTGPVLGPATSTALLVASAVSRLQHGAAGSFDFGLVSGQILETRIPGPRQLVVGFNQAVDPASLAVAINGLASGAYIGATTLSLNAGNTELTIDLDPALADVDRHTVDLTGVTSLSTGLPLQNPTFAVAVLQGDVSRDLAVTTGDASQVRFFFNQTADAVNFPFDVDASGSITTGDFSQIRFFFNNTLP